MTPHWFNFFGRWDFDRHKIEKFHKDKKIKTYNGQYPIYYKFTPDYFLNDFYLECVENPKNQFICTLRQKNNDKELVIVHELYCTLRQQEMVFDKAVNRMVAIALQQRHAIEAALTKIKKEQTELFRF